MAVRISDDVIEDVGAAAEALTADDGAPLHQIESLCMRCGQNVSHSSLTLSHTLSYSPSPSLLWLSLRWIVSFVTRPQLVAVGIESSAPCTAGWSSLLGVSLSLQF
jgi:hypothetical protein